MLTRRELFKTLLGGVTAMVVAPQMIQVGQSYATSGLFYKGVPLTYDACLPTGQWYYLDVARIDVFDRFC